MTASDILPILRLKSLRKNYVMKAIKENDLSMRTEDPFRALKRSGKAPDIRRFLSTRSEVVKMVKISKNAIWLFEEEEKVVEEYMSLCGVTKREAVRDIFKLGCEKWEEMEPERRRQ